MLCRVSGRWEVKGCSCECGSNGELARHEVHVCTELFM